MSGSISIRAKICLVDNLIVYFKSDSDNHFRIEFKFIFVVLTYLVSVLFI